MRATDMHVEDAMHARDSRARVMQLEAEDAIPSW